MVELPIPQFIWIYHNRRNAFSEKHLAQFSSISYRKDYQDFLPGFNPETSVRNTLDQTDVT
jgi:hypothetical protein